MKNKTRIPNPVTRILKLCEQIDAQNHDFIANDPHVLLLQTEALALRDQHLPDKVDAVIDEIAVYAKSFNANHLVYSNVAVGDIIGFRANHTTEIHPVRVLEKSRFSLKVQSDTPNQALPFPQHIPHLVKWSTRLNRYYSGMGWIVPYREEEES